MALRRIPLVLLALLLLFGAALAHSGGTDSKGGHWNHSTGEYHYHHGKPAHQHPNGICPYDKSSKKATAKEKESDSSLLWIAGVPIAAGAGYAISKRKK